MFIKWGLIVVISVCQLNLTVQVMNSFMNSKRSAVLETMMEYAKRDLVVRREEKKVLLHVSGK